MSFSGRNPIGVVSLKAGVMGGNFNSRGFDDLGNGGFNINGSRADENNDFGRRGHRHPDAVERRHHRHSERRRRPGSAGPHGQLHAGVRARQRRPDPVRDQERQQPVQRKRVDLLSRRLAAGQHLDAQSQHEPVRKQRPGAVRLPAVRLHPRRTDTGEPDERPVLLLRRAGVCRLLRARDQYGDGADRGDAARRLQRAAEPEQWVLFGRARHYRSAHGPAVSEQRHPAIAAVAERPGVAEHLSVADGRVPAGHGQPHSEQREPARTAKRHDPARLPSEWLAPAHLSLLGIRLDRRRCVPRHLPVRAHRLGPAQRHADRELERHAPQQPAERDELFVFAGRSLHQRVHRDRPAPAEPHRHQLPVHLPGEGDRGQAPDHHDRGLQRDRRRSVPRVLARADSYVLEHDHPGQGTPLVQGGRDHGVLRRG